MLVRSSHLRFFCFSWVPGLIQQPAWPPGPRAAGPAVPRAPHRPHLWRPRLSEAPYEESQPEPGGPSAASTHRHLPHEHRCVCRAWSVACPRWVGVLGSLHKAPSWEGCVRVCVSVCPLSLQALWTASAIDLCDGDDGNQTGVQFTSLSMLYRKEVKGQWGGDLVLWDRQIEESRTDCYPSLLTYLMNISTPRKCSHYTGCKRPISNAG